MARRRTGPIEGGRQGVFLTNSSIDRAKAAWVLQVGFFGLSSFGKGDPSFPYQTISHFFLFHFEPGLCAYITVYTFIFFL
jgi:hypothetical protein